MPDVSNIELTVALPQLDVPFTDIAVPPFEFMAFSSPLEFGPEAVSINIGVGVDFPIGGVPPPVTPSVPPVVSNLTPAVGTAITNSTPLEFDVTDAQGFVRVLVVADFPNLKTREVVHDGESFGPSYSNPTNQRLAITDGFHFVILRNSGWPASPTLITYAIDTGGAENT